MAAPPGRRSGRKSSEVRNICFCLWTRKIVVVANLWKPKEIKDSDNIVTLDISAKFHSLNNMENTSSESKEKLERSGNGLVTDLAFKTKLRSPKYQKAKYAIGNFSEKDFLKIIKEFEKIGKLPYEKKMLKHEPTPSYFQLVRQLATCILRSDEINQHINGSYRWKTALSLNITVTDEDK